MDLLRNLGSAAVSSLVQKSGLNLPFTLGDKVLYFEGKTIWTLYEGTKRDDGTPVSIFFFDANQSNRRNLLPLAKNALRKLRTVRHPDVLKFYDAVETDTSVHIMTERVQPLGKTLSSLPAKGPGEKEDWLVWGLHRLTTALAFVNDSCASTHGNIRIDSVFTTPSGEWKLGGFDVLSNAKDDAAVLYNLGSLVQDANIYASPEVKKGGWSSLKEHHPSVADAYALGLLIHFAFNPSQPLPATASPPHPPPQPSSRGSIPTYLFPSFKKLLNPNAKARLSPSAFLEAGMALTGGEGQGFFAKNRFVQICAGLDGFALSSEADKMSLLRTVKESAASMPPGFASHRVLPSLVHALEYGGATANTILPLVLQLGTHASPSEYPTVVLAPVLKLYASPDRGTRMVLLEQLGEYADKLDNKAVSDKIWPHLQTGFNDTVAVIREATVKAIGLLYPKFNDRIMNNELLRHLAKMQMDPEASIRTNTCILIGRMGPTLGYNTKRKVLVLAFSRALKDVFVHARVAGLMAFMATIDCFDVEEVATKVIPCISCTLVDKEKLVREQAFKAVDLFVKRLESHAATMPDTVIPNGGQATPTSSSPVVPGQATLVNSAAGAAGALAGWAMSSLGKKLVPGDLQTVMSSVGSIDRPLSAPITPAGTSNGRLGASPLSSPPESALSSPGMPTASLGTLPSQPRAKGLQLGANKQSASAKAAALATEMASEMGGDAGDAWGTDDLMDVNADEEDWSAFESASDRHAMARSTSAQNLGFGVVPSFSVQPVAVNDDDPWGNIDAGASSTEPARDLWNLDEPKPSTSSLRPQRSKATLTSKAAPTPSSGRSSPNLPALLSVASSESVASPLSSPVPSLAGMSKEDKAAEMARRKEERKQRIAQLKEQKKVSAPAA